MKTILQFVLGSIVVSFATPAFACMPERPNGATEFLNWVQCRSSDSQNWVRLGMFATADKNRFASPVTYMPATGASKSDVIFWQVMDIEGAVTLERKTDKGVDTLILDQNVLKPRDGSYFPPDQSVGGFRPAGSGETLDCSVAYLRC